MGRPTKMTLDTIKRLEEAFAMGCSDLEACFWADISKAALYEYQLRNPAFTDRKEALKERPIFLARKAMMNNLEGGEDADFALKYAERKKKDEFSLRTETQLQNDPENPIQMVIIIPNVQIGQKD
jgi:hypothetical protein